MNLSHHTATRTPPECPDSGHRPPAAPALRQDGRLVCAGSRARQHLPTRRGMFGRRCYDADTSTNSSTPRTPTRGGDGRGRTADGRTTSAWRTLEHSRRHGLLPSGNPTRTWTRTRYELVMQAQQTADQILADAGRQAAALVADARRHYLHTDNRPHDRCGATGDRGWRVRAEQAEALNGQPRPVPATSGPSWLTSTAGQHARHRPAPHRAAAARPPPPSAGYLTDTTAQGVSDRAVRRAPPPTATPTTPRRRRCSGWWTSPPRSRPGRSGSHPPCRQRYKPGTGRCAPRSPNHRTG